MLTDRKTWPIVQFWYSCLWLYPIFCRPVLEYVNESRLLNKHYPHLSSFQFYGYLNVVKNVINEWIWRLHNLHKEKTQLKCVLFCLMQVLSINVIYEGGGWQFLTLCCLWPRFQAYYRCCLKTRFYASES